VLILWQEYISEREAEHLASHEKLRFHQLSVANQGHDINQYRAII
jgi:hypothetical protein